MRIDVGGRHDLGVSESFHHDPQRYALSEQERRAGVAEVVETVVSDPCLRETTLELAGYGVRFQWAACHWSQLYAAQGIRLVWSGALEGALH